MDLELALEKLWNYFSIQHLLLEGGSEINGAFERAGLIDELSLVQASVIADADILKLQIFYSSEKSGLLFCSFSGGYCA